MENLNSITTSNSTEDMNTCSICIENLAEERGTPNCCAHVFCAKCIKPWVKLNGTCPLDRKRIHAINVSSQADASFKETIVIETIEYSEFFTNELTSGLSGFSEEDQVEYLQRKLLVLSNIRSKILHRLRSDNNCFTLFVDSGDNVIMEEMILSELAVRKHVVLGDLDLLQRTSASMEP